MRQIHFYNKNNSNNSDNLILNFISEFQNLKIFLILFH